MSIGTMLAPSPPPPPPPPLHHQRHETQESPGGIPAASPVILIVVPFVVIFVLIIFFSLLLLHCRVKRMKEKSKHSSNSCTSSFRTCSLEERQLSKFSSSIDIRTISYRSDMKSCIYGAKFRCSPQVQYKRGQVFTYKELELATDGFSEGNVIGKGGYGVVFRANLSDGTLVAIKMLQREGKQGEREFRQEVDLLSRLHSNYLLGLLGYCADQHHRLLVFEFMPNGSLQQHLHPNSNDNHHMVLDWSSRLRIALDCARGLEFLHEHTVPAVIHRDFKCSNILLDQNYRAKVSDFGMAKLGSDKINGQVMTRVLGTQGYVAPEYASTGKLTTKSDVYSYGVVLLELLTGRKPIDTKKPHGEQVLVSWALPRLTKREKVKEMVDPALKGQYSQKDLVQIAAIAAMCVQSESDYRPLMPDVVQSLIPLVKNQAAFCPTTPSRFPHETAISCLY